MLNHRICIPLGDTSDQCYRFVDPFYIYCNKSAMHLEEAYYILNDRFNFNFRDKVCGDANESFLDVNTWKQLVEFGINPNICKNGDIQQDCNSNVDGYYLDPEEFIKLFMNYLKLDIPDLQGEFDNDYEYLDISNLGYGLYI